MRSALILVFAVAACGDDGGSGPVDARVDGAGMDALLLDGPVDASVDAPSDPDAAMGTITAACTSACTKLGMCFDDPSDSAGCVDECSADLADCTPSEVSDVEACGQATCVGDDEEQWEVTMCISAIACVDM